MISVLANLWISFLAGLFAPLGAVCVLPLYPGFLAFLAKQVEGKENQKKTIILLGLFVILGVLISSFILGLVFVTIFKTSLTSVIGIVSPIAFGILGIISILMIFNIDFSRIFPHIKTPEAKNPFLNSLLFGAFFSLIIIPCNPASITVLFAISSSTTSFLTNLLNFILFGIGMGIPLFLISIISGTAGKKFIHFLTNNKRWINLIAGIIMLIISVYYIFFVFHILG
ncbi:hypothetical protein K9L67_02265 [Candidatus Woesearchaeota archaeon]|nr:hypothetical protein [Candidatus Woesearchaeota archaeon]MCF7901029.1 hypothetical protein [Candidatus Woesearchaeota archaeon]MCF8013390.1 hypothetical protein [Candidatus Woesearchaeota archaeon]